MQNYPDFKTTLLVTDGTNRQYGYRTPDQQYQPTLPN